jgi:geranylgeranyl transferase type-1 subunit beta
MKDIYHSYLALATLAMMKEKGLKELDPMLCTSCDLKNKIHNASLEYWT